MGRRTDIPGSLIHHLSPLVAGKDSGEQLVLSIEEASRLSTPPKSAVAPLTQPQQHFLQLSAPTQQMGQGSQPALALTKNCWIAIPSITQPSAGPSSTQHISGHVPTKSFCRNTSVQLETQHLLSIRDLLSPCPTTEAALTLAGLEGRCSFCKGDSWVESRTPGPLVPSPRL